MRPYVKSTILFSLLGLSSALNATLAVGYFRGGAESTVAAAPAGEDYCLLDRLKLDAEQRNRLAEMRRKMHEKRAAFQRRAAELKSELAETISATQVDRAALNGLLGRYTENQAAMQRAVVEHLIGVGAMLHPEQRDEFRTLLHTEIFHGMRSSREP